MKEQTKFCSAFVEGLYCAGAENHSGQHQFCPGKHSETANRLANRLYETLTAQLEVMREMREALNACHSAMWNERTGVYLDKTDAADELARAVLSKVKL